MFRKFTFAIITSMPLLSACSSHEQRPPSVTDQNQYYSHTVSSQGETLASISKWYTGNAKNWQQILTYNPSLDVKRIRIGTQIRIPRSMMVKSTPMPKSAVAVATPKAEEGEIGTIVPSAQQPASNTEVVLETETTESVAVNAPQPEPSNLESQATSEFESQVTGESEIQLPADNSQTAPNENEDKGFFAKISEGARKAKDAAIKVQGGTPQAGSTNPEAVSAQTSAINSTSEQQEIKAAEEQIKTAQQDAINAEKAPRPAQDASDGSLKTREELLKELSQDY